LLLHFDIISGISGDMTVGALLHLGAPLDPLRRALDAMGLSDVALTSRGTSRHGIGCVQFVVDVPGKTATHRTWGDIRKLLVQAGLPAGAKERAEAVFARLAEAEAAVHQQSPEQVLFHEVGAADSIADIVGCALAIDHFNPERITSSTPLLGSGVVKSRHGEIPIPAPATLELLKGISTRGLAVDAELTTPTGAAILSAMVDQFTSWPEMAPTGIGYGAGRHEIDGRPNLLRIVIGEGVSRAAGEELLVEANIDDMSPEHYDYLMEKLLAAGAHDVWLQPVIMKKSRPAVTLSLLCNEDQLDTLERFVFEESTTIGLRRLPVVRRKLTRRSKTVQTSFGPVRIKIAGEGGRVYTASPEYDDCRRLAEQQGVPLKTVYAAAEAAWKEED
jgi:pyridinium-3,5-bisthiocarboxylic acid mononucleotide nickel chelatase